MILPPSRATTRFRGAGAARGRPRLLGEADVPEGPRHGRPDPATRRAGDLEGEGDVLADRLGRQELEVLEDRPDLAPDVGHLSPGQPREVLAVEDDLSP